MNDIFDEYSRFFSGDDEAVQTRKETERKREQYRFRGHDGSRPRAYIHLGLGRNHSCVSFSADRAIRHEAS